MIPLLAVAIASLAAISVVNAHLATVRTRDRVEAQLQGVAGVLAGRAFPLTGAVLRQMSELSGADFVLTSAGGRPAASSRSDITDLGARTIDHAAARRAGDVTLGPVIELDGERYYYSSLVIAERSGSDSAQVLHILFPQDDYNMAWRAMFVPPLLVGLAAVAGVIATTQLVASRIKRVLDCLGNEVRRLADGDFSAVKVPSVDDETRDLALAVNQTAERLVDYESQTRRTEQMRTLALLGSGLAHEMRNAATGCRMAFDLHSEVCPADRNQDDSLDMARHQLGLMERRLEKFLRLGKPTTTEVNQQIDLVELIDDLVPLVRPSASHAHVDVEWQPPAGTVELRADPEQLSQAIVNLLLNALEAATKRAAETRTAGRVRVELRMSGEAVTVTVADSGDGPPADLAPTMFDPFVSAKPEGVGLGLAVTRQVAEDYGGTLDWQRTDDETQFSLHLPLQAEE